jgi:hypothetical protein
MRTLWRNLWQLTESPVGTQKPAEINLLKMFLLLRGDFTARPA